MHSQPVVQDIASSLLAKTDLELISCDVIKSLWAGYGYICQVTARSKGGIDKDNQPISLILKYIDPPQMKPKKPVEEGHIRKILSYQIEQYFYNYLVPQMPPDIGIASCISSLDFRAQEGSVAMLLDDLRPRFPLAGEARSQLSEAQTYAALRWLAKFHGFWWTRHDQLRRGSLCPPPLQHFADTGTTSLERGSIWLNGGYTYLATRRSEYRELASDEGSQWSEVLCQPTDNKNLCVAELVANAISPAIDADSGSDISQYTTLIHGDVKSENLFTSRDGKQAAFFDFQYVGLGLGVCDLAKLFTCSVPVAMLSDDRVADDVARIEEGEVKLLRFYHSELQEASGKEYNWQTFVKHWETALVDWLRFQASWGFWGNTEWLECRVRSILEDDEWKQWLQFHS